MRRVPGLHIVAAADLLEERRQRGRELLGGEVKFHGDPREMLAGAALGPTFADRVHSMEVGETIQSGGYREFGS